MAYAHAIAAPGCYRYHADGVTFSHVIIFEAIPD
jgi:hypothetical protein